MLLGYTNDGDVEKAYSLKAGYVVEVTGLRAIASEAALRILKQGTLRILKQGVLQILKKGILEYKKERAVEVAKNVVYGTVRKQQADPAEISDVLDAVVLLGILDAALIYSLKAGYVVEVMGLRAVASEAALRILKQGSSEDRKKRAVEVAESMVYEALREQQTNPSDDLGAVVLLGIMDAALVCRA
ncbi:hypothetical protein [Shimazuella kribbensis]|uniref:hypothetical protein n=1 Tax=Shimazuella kribbensis TaxID=139808 RepID=UPI0004063C98|nr:hypothetical protein [Shimazuella kribbensis]